MKGNPRIKGRFCKYCICCVWEKGNKSYRYFCEKPDSDNSVRVKALGTCDDWECAGEV